jgi:hypothetical protein
MTILLALRITLPQLAHALKTGNARHTAWNQNRTDKSLGLRTHETAERLGAWETGRAYETRPVGVQHSKRRAGGGHKVTEAEVTDGAIRASKNDDTPQSLLCNRNIRDNTSRLYQKFLFHPTGQKDLRLSPLIAGWIRSYNK